MQVSDIPQRPWIKECGGLSVMMIFCIMLVYGIFVWTLPSILGLLGFFGGEILLALLMIWLSSATMQQVLLGRHQDEAVKAASDEKSPAPGWLVPELRTLLIRNTYAFIGTLLAWILIWGAVLGAVALVAFLGNDFLEERLSRLIGLLISLPLGIAGLYLSFMVLPITGAIVDFYWMRDENLLQVWYPTPDDNPLQLKKLFENLGGVLKASLIAGVGFGLLALFQIWANTSEWGNQMLPSWLAILILGGMGLGIPLLGVWWFWGSNERLKRQMQALETEIEAEIIQEHGVESPEYREYEAYKVASAKQENSLSQQSHSQAGKLMALVFFIGIPVFSLIAGLIIAELNITDEPGKLGSLVGMSIAVVLFFALLGRWSKVTIPDDMLQAEAALQKGDYETAKRYADEIYQKYPPAEVNLLVAQIYANSDEIPRAIELCQEGIRELMAVDAEHRNTKLLTTYLWIMAAFLVSESRYEEADQALQQAQHYDPTQYPIYTNLAEVLLFQGKSPQQALQYIETAFQYNDKRPASEQSPMLIARLLRAWALNMLGQVDEAKRWIEEALQKVDKENKPLLGEVYYYAGEASLAKPARMAAQAFFKQAIQVNPNGMNGRLAQKRLNQLEQSKP